MKFTRRQFLKTAAAASAGIGFPTVVPSSVLGQSAVPPANRIVLGIIGTGGRGRWLIDRFIREPDVQVRAVCDVDAGHLNGARDAINRKYGGQDCLTFRDFRELLADRDLDAVCVATPDHWHAVASIAVVAAGKDVYCEKPLTNSIGEGRALADAVKKSNRILQTGSHERSGDNARFACELVRNGAIGKLHTVRINLPCTDRHHQRVRAATAMPPAQPVPDGFDYDRWLGPAPLAPYYKERCHGSWRFILAYGGGEMTDRGAHVIDLGQLGAGMDDTGPVEIEAAGVRNPSGIYDGFWDYKFTNTYASGLKLIGGTDTPRGVRFEGDKGWIFIHVHGARLEASDPGLPGGLDAWKKAGGRVASHKIQLGRSAGQAEGSPDDRHPRDFLDCVKNRKQPIATAEIGHRTASICHLNNLAMQLGRKLKWDPKKERFIGDDEANKLVTPVMRPPWGL